MRPLPLTVPLLVHAALGQSAGNAAIDTDDAALARWAMSLRAAAIATPAGANAADAARGALACLRAGDLAGARNAVAAARLAATVAAAPPLADVCWSLLALGWYVDAAGDDAFAATAWPTLRAALRQLAHAPAAPRFADECLAIQACFAVASLCHRAGGEALPWTNRALVRSERLERTAWQRMRGRFRSAADDGLLAKRAHPPAEPGDLAAAWLGLGAPTGPLPRHGRSALAELTARAAATPAADSMHAAAVRLAAATELGDASARCAALAALRRFPADGAGPADAALALDALLFALTGLRQATACGRAGELVDAVELAPWLPHGARSLRLHGVVAAGATFDLEVSARVGPPGADERDAAACLAGARPRLVVVVAMRATADGAPRAILLRGLGDAAIAALAGGERWLASLPTPQLDAQHQLRGRGDRR